MPGSDVLATCGHPHNICFGGDAQPRAAREAGGERGVRAIHHVASVAARQCDRSWCDSSEAVEEPRCPGDHPVPAG